MNNSRRVRRAGTLYVVGSVLWLGLAGMVAVIFGGDPPPESAGFYPIQIIWATLQLLLLFGFFGVLWSGGVGRSLFGKIAFGLGVLGHLVFAAGEIHSLVSRTTSDLVVLGALVAAVGMLLTGIAVLTAKQWQGWTRWMPLLAGLYPWLLMFPFIAISGDPSPYAIAGWGLARLALGLAIRAQADAMPATASSRAAPLRQGSV